MPLLCAPRQHAQLDSQSSTFAYDAEGHLTGVTGPQTQTFTYDALNRLKSAAAIGGTAGLYSESYEYDASSGNLLSKAGVTYNYDDPLHAHAVASLSNGNSYLYDENGNTLAPGAHLPRAQVPGSAGVITRTIVSGPLAGYYSRTPRQRLDYSYDASSNITQIGNAEAAESQTYGYDALNRLTDWSLNGNISGIYEYGETNGNLEKKGTLDLQ